MKELIAESLNLIVNGVVVTDPNKKDNPIIYVNNAFTKITGYDAKEVIGKNCRFLQGKDSDNEELNKLRRAIKRKKSSKVILKNYKKNRELFWNELYVSPIVYKGKTYFIGIQHDVTERVRAEQRLEKYKEELETQVEQRTQKIRDVNTQLLREIEENKESRKKIILLNEKLINYSKTTKQKIEKEKLTIKEIIIKEQLINKDYTIKQLSEKTNLSMSTISTIKKRLLQKNLEEIFLPNIKLFNLVSLIIYRNETPSFIPEEAFFVAQGKDSGFYFTANKSWLEFNKIHKNTNLKNAEIHHFDTTNTEITFLGEKFNDARIKKTEAKTLYALTKFYETKKAAERTEQTIQTITNHLKKLKKQRALQKKYYEKTNLQEAIELVSTEGTFLTIKDDDKVFGINMLKNWTGIKEETEIIIPVKESKTRIDFANTIKNNLLTE